MGWDVTTKFCSLQFIKLQHSIVQESIYIFLILCFYVYFYRIKCFSRYELLAGRLVSERNIFILTGLFLANVYLSLWNCIICYFKANRIYTGRQLENTKGGLASYIYAVFLHSFLTRKVMSNFLSSFLRIGQFLWFFWTS